MSVWWGVPVPHSQQELISAFRRYPYILEPYSDAARTISETYKIMSWQDNVVVYTFSRCSWYCGRFASMSFMSFRLAAPSLQAMNPWQGLKRRWPWLTPSWTQHSLPRICWNQTLASRWLPSYAYGERLSTLCPNLIMWPSCPHMFPQMIEICTCKMYEHQQYWRWHDKRVFGPILDGKQIVGHGLISELMNEWR